LATRQQLEKVSACKQNWVVDKTTVDGRLELSSDCAVQQAESITGGKSSIEASQAFDSVNADKNLSGTGVARAIIVAVAGAMAWYTWGHWGDFQIDCGREIYVPAAILQGKLLYRDIWYMYGMLAPYVQALLFHIFGISLTVLFIFGLALTIGSALLVFEIARQFDLGLPVSLLPSLFFLSEAFYPFTFNFVFPYSYAAALATFLGLACLYFVVRHALGMRPIHLGIAALFGALAILTKQEFGLACLFLLAFEVVASYFIRRSARQLGQNLAICFAGLLPAMVGYGWFTWKLSAKLIFFDNWIATPGTYQMRTFGKYTMARTGFRFVPQEMISAAALALLSLALWYGIAYANVLAIKGRRQSRIILLAVALDILVITLLIFQVMKFSTLASFYVAQLTFPQGLFFLGLYFVIQALWKLCRSPKPGLALPDAVLGIYATLSSFRVLMDLYPSPYKYSVFFNVPLYLIFTILIARLVRWAGRSLDLRNRNALVNCLLCSAAGLYFVAILPDRRYLPTPVKTDIGTFYTKRDVAILLPQIISFMKTHTRNGRDILVIPDPPSFYVYAGMQSPTRWYSLVPGVVDPEHEQDFINEVTANDVRYVLLSNRAFPECGVGTFGSGYNAVLYQWLTKNFRRVEKFGPLPIGFPDSYVLNVYERKDIVPAL
jgi:hypothetical protein